MTKSHILGFPVIGANRQMKKAVEAYWREEITAQELQKVGEEIQKDSWKLQADAGLDYVTVGDFSWYDRVLDTSAMFGVVPSRFDNVGKEIDLNTIFCMARGKAPKVKEATACEMTKWFNTNYHYIVPEIKTNQQFKLSTDYLFKSIEQAQQLHYQVKPVLLGPLSYLWLAKAKERDLNKLSLLKNLLLVYQQIIDRLQTKKIEWLQIDEPILVLDLPTEWREAFTEVYRQLNFGKTKCLLATYFGDLDENFSFIKDSHIAGMHLDFSKDLQGLVEIAKKFPNNKVLSAGVVNGRNVWKADLNKILKPLIQAKEILDDRLWVSSSCSLIHVPVNLDREKPELKVWLSFAKEKIEEIALLGKILNQGRDKFSEQLSANQAAIESRKTSELINNAIVKERVAKLTPEFAVRNNRYEKRAFLQRKKLQLPILPTTTIGSFPQTSEIRSIRQDFKSGKISEANYIEQIKKEIAFVIKKQETLDVDVLVHGESERNDMVEYFGELLSGFAFTKNGWVQSYGSRCVKPPIIYGDVARPNPMTVSWSQYAQQLTSRTR